MKQRIYIFSNTIIKRNQNTLQFETVLDENKKDEQEELKEEYYLDERHNLPSGDKKYIPVENVESIFAVGSVRFNSRFLYFLSRNRIPMHVFNYRGNYAGSFLPAERLVSGSALLHQTDHYKDYKKRLFIAGEFVSAAAHNTIANLRYHLNKEACLADYIESIQELMMEIKTCSSVEELMGIEGIIKKTYYDAWKHIFIYPVEFYKRIKNPPPDMINSLISYGNMIVYGVVINEIYQTRLNPEIGFLHTPADAKLSLCYDIADIFKPLFTDRIIFKVINKNILTQKDFYAKNGFCRIKKEARRRFASEFETKLNTKFTEKVTGRRFSYKRIVREECYKLLEHFNDGKKYKSFRTKW